MKVKYEYAQELKPYRQLKTLIQFNHGRYIIRWSSRRTWAHLLQEHQNYKELLNNHQQEDAGTHQKKISPHPKTKKKPQWDGRRGSTMIKSNPIPARCVTHKLENNNTKEFLQLLWRFWTPLQASQPWNLTKGLAIHWEFCPWRSVRFDYRTYTRLGETEIPILEGTNKILCSPRPKGKEQRPNRLNQNYLLVLGGLLWRHRSAGAHHRDGDTGSIRLRMSPFA